MVREEDCDIGCMLLHACIHTWRLATVVEEDEHNKALNYSRGVFR